MVAPASPPLTRSKPRSLLTAGLAAMVLGSAVVLSFSFYDSQVPTANRFAPVFSPTPANPPYHTMPSVQVQQPPPVVIVPETRIREGHVQERSGENTAGPDYRRTREHH